MIIEISQQRPCHSIFLKYRTKLFKYSSLLALRWSGTHTFLKIFYVVSIFTSIPFVLGICSNQLHNINGIVGSTVEPQPLVEQYGITIFCLRLLALWQNILEIPGKIGNAIFPRYLHVPMTKHHQT